MKPRKWIVITLVLLLLATALHIAGLVAPCWIYLKTSDYRVGVGLYYRVGCEASSGNNCTNPAFPTDLQFGYNSAATYDEPEWEAVLWLETIAALPALTLCIMMVVYLIGFGFWRRMGALNMAMVLFAVITWLLSAAGIIVYVIFYGDVIVKSSDLSRESFPWSVLMVFIAALLFVVITILLRLRCRNRNYLQHAIPTSADSKMGLNPLTKSQVMKRYFTPSPYREDRREGITSNPALSTADQSGLALPDSQPNGFGQTQAGEYSYTIGNIHTNENLHANGNLQTIGNLHTIRNLNTNGNMHTNGNPHTNGNIRSHNSWQQGEVMRAETNIIQTQQLRPGIATRAESPRPGYVQQKLFNTVGVLTPASDERSRNKQQTADHQRNQRYQQTVQTTVQTHTTQANDRVHGKRGLLDDTEIDNLDSQTIFYKGPGDVTMKNLSFVHGLTTDQGQGGGYGDAIESRAYTNRAFVTEQIGVRVEQDKRLKSYYNNELLTPFPSRGDRSPSIGSYRMGAVHRDAEPFRELATTHMRRPHGADRVLMGAPLNNGDGGFNYNRKFMYRPYSEQSY